MDAGLFILFRPTINYLAKSTIKLRDHAHYSCAKRSLTYLAGESPVIEGKPIPLCSESCVNVGNETDEA